MMVTEHELARDPRARRAARTARELGFDVVELSPPEAQASRARALVGSVGRQRPLVRELRGMWRLGRLVTISTRLVRAARAVARVDAVHANDFDTLPAAWRIARRDGARLIYDAHEIYTAQEPDPPRIHRFVSGALEGWLARRADAVVTVNDPIAKELKRRLRLAGDPLVVLNCPSVQDVPDPAPAEGPLRAVYQGAMGPGRYIDDLLAAAGTMGDTELTLRVAGADLDALRKDVDARGLGDRVRVVSPVAPDALVESLAGFEVGLIINRPVTLNDELVLPNKLFEYLMAGLAVVVPRLPALESIVDGVGLTFTPSDPASLAAVLSGLAQNRNGLQEMREEARRRALTQYNSQRQAAVLTAAWQA
jgi:glycogen(starch) synthase